MLAGRAHEGNVAIHTFKAILTTKCFGKTPNHFVTSPSRTCRIPVKYRDKLPDRGKALLV